MANAFGGGTGTVPNPSLVHHLSKTTDGGKTSTPKVPDREGGAGIGGGVLLAWPRRRTA